MKATNKSILVFLIGLSFFCVSCSSNSDDSNVLENKKSDDNIEVNQSKIILDEMNLVASFNFPSATNNETKQPEVIVTNDNFSITVSYNFETEVEVAAE